MAHCPFQPSRRPPEASGTREACLNVGPIEVATHGDRGGSMPSPRLSPFAECLLALKGRDLAPEEFVSVLIELGCLAYLLRRRGRASSNCLDTSA